MVSDYGISPSSSFCSASSPSSLLSRAHLTSPVPENTRKLVDKVAITERSFALSADHIVFIEEAQPPEGHFCKGSVLLLHGQSFNSSTWRETVRVFAAAGFRCVAPDLPGCGRTKGPCVAADRRPDWLRSLREHLCLKEVLVVCASMSAPYILPLLGEPWLVGLVAVAPSSTHTLGEARHARTPVLVLYGEKDTSLGPTAAANLSVLPNHRVFRIEGAGHAVHLGNPMLFQALALNFFQLLRSYKQSTAV